MSLDPSFESIRILLKASYQMVPRRRQSRCPYLRQALWTLASFRVAARAYKMGRMAAPPTNSKLADPKSATTPVAQESVSPKDDAKALPRETAAERPREIGGPSGPEPTRYGDWERNGRVSDF
jgi:hypothetical protein